ncbi:hypothetical protein HPB50_026447 [Hyalomma asiaticum]|uniref:Uncharacterized protein n=1 Tax=Hyalomma asiaticum TaxID=266040 RepID=A0ACB7T2C2_HYAAI|nr:hypothetical protein HPB50_026447 [Hyalomma asiaticum]
MPPSDRRPPLGSPPASLECASPVASGLSETEGLLCLKAQAAKIFGNKKGKLVCKDTAQALWSSSVLATRSVGGNVAPKKRALAGLQDEQPIVETNVGKGSRKNGSVTLGKGLALRGPGRARVQKQDTALHRDCVRLAAVKSGAAEPGPASGPSCGKPQLCIFRGLRA